jgi:predicted RNase H-like HicB family nuclease
VGGYTAFQEIKSTYRWPGTLEVAMKYTVLIEESDDGFAVSVPGLPGCHSQGNTEAEALANIADAIREYLAVVEEGVPQDPLKKDLAC